MANRVGAKGQVVIERRIRAALGVETGAVAYQTLVGEHVEIRFRAPLPLTSLLGALRPYLGRRPVDPDDTEAAWVDEGMDGEASGSV